VGGAAAVQHGLCSVTSLATPDYSSNLVVHSSVVGGAPAVQHGSNSLTYSGP